MKGHVELLKEELMKLKGFWVPNDVKSAASAAVKEINSCKAPAVICKQNAATVELTRILLNPSKDLKSEALVLSRIVDCIRRDMFKGPALTQVLIYFLEASKSLDFEVAMKLLQHSTSCIVAEFPNIKLISVCLSLSLALMERDDPSISETSFASFQQMSAILMDNVQKGDTDMTSYLLQCDETFPGMKEKFKNPLMFLLFLIFNDLCRLSEKAKPDFFRDVKPPAEVVFEILADLANSQVSLIRQEPEIMNLLRNKLKACIENAMAVEFVASVVLVLLDDRELVRSVTQQFLNKLQFDRSNISHPLGYFHFLSLRNAFEQLFFGSEDSMQLLVMLFNTLIDHFEAPKSPVVFTLKPWRRSEKLAQVNMYRTVATVEIIFGAVMSFWNAPNVNISKAANSMGILILLGVKYSAMRSFNKVTEYLNKFLVILSKQKLMVRMLNKFESFELVFGEAGEGEKQLFCYEEKSKKWPSVLCEMIMESPDICDDHWEMFADVILKGEMTPSFANAYSNMTAMDILLAVVKYTPFPRKFVVDYLICNMNRFTLLWPIVESRIANRKINGTILLEFYKSLMLEGFSVSTEVELLRFSKLVIKSEVSKTEKLNVLQKLRNIIDTHVSEIKEGWGSMFELLNPSNFGQEEELISLAFDILCHINCDSIGAQYVPLYVDSGFLFIGQKINDKISEEALAIVRGMAKRIEDRNTFFGRITQVCQDPRPSIAMSGMNAYFAIFAELLSSGLLQKRHFAGFVESGFSKFVQSFERVPELKQAVLERLAELCCNHWQSFREVESFETTFIPSLIQMADSVNSKFVAFYGYFYKCTFVTDQVEILLRRSIEMRIPLIAKSNDEELFQSFGHLLSVVLKQKEVKVPIKKWMPILQKMALQLQAPDATRVHPSIQRPFQVIPALFPIERGPAVEVTSSLSTIVIRSKSVVLRQFVVSLLVSIVRKCQYLIFECRETFALPESDPLVPSLAIARVDDESVAFECYTAVLGRNGADAQQFVSKVMDMLPFIDCEAQKSFILRHYKDISLTIDIWKTYFSKSSPKYESLFFEDCFTTAVEALRRFLSDSTHGDEELSTFLDFVGTIDIATDDPKWYKQKLGDLLAKLLETNITEENKKKISSLIE